MTQKNQQDVAHRRVIYKHMFSYNCVNNIVFLYVVKLLLRAKK